MESDKIALLLEHYFEGTTTVAEELELKNYFSRKEVAPHLVQYQPLFNYYTEAKEVQGKSELTLPKKKVQYKVWFSMAASVAILIGVGVYTYTTFPSTTTTNELGTYKDPEEAFRATEKALTLLSNHVNVGIGSLQYIEQYESARDQVFTTE